MNTEGIAVLNRGVRVSLSNMVGDIQERKEKNAEKRNIC